jgi:hypothetical protein
MRRALASFVFVSLVTGGCTDSSVDDDGAADINHNDEEKADGAQGIEVLGRLRPGTVDTTLTTATPRPGFVC